MDPCLSLSLSLLNGGYMLLKKYVVGVEYMCFTE